MAIGQPQQPPPPPQRSGRFVLTKCAALILLFLIVLVGLAVLIIWLVVHPRRLVFTVDDVYVDHYNLTKDQLDATFDLSLRAYNPNHRVSVHYDDIQVTVEYDHQDLASGTAEPFLQRHWNETKLHVMPQAREVALLRHVSKNLRTERTSGAVQLEVRLRARVRFKVGTWKSRHRTLRVYCAPVLGVFTRARSYGTKDCDVEL
ncbi:LEA_2 domain-containing protein [Psidium guajava]|nr:LEA_2 domain-containing protein [Psidium guajava]